MSTSPARRVALDAIGRVRRDSAWVHETVRGLATRAGLQPRDIALATRLAVGVTEYQGTLDDVIDRYADRPSRIEPLVRDVLRLATYELIFLSTPARAVVNDAVGAVRSKRRSTAGYVNAVLRRIADHAHEFPFGDPDSELDALARQTGHPLWIAELLVRDLGRPLARTMLLADAERAPFTLAANPFVTDTDALVARLQDAGADPSPGVVPHSVVCSDGLAAIASGVLDDGSALASDAGAQAVAAATASLARGAASPARSVRIADIAAGRGTKTALMQAHLHRTDSTSEIIAVDVHDFKSTILSERMKKLGVPGVTTCTVDATVGEALFECVGAVDVALVDAPCSGLGTLRRNPEKRWTLTEADIAALAALGAAMLEAAAVVVRPGGFVVYSTCTVTRAENHDVIESFLGTHGAQFELQSLAEHLPAGVVQWVDKKGMFQSVPVPAGMDGHFAACIKRTD